MCSHVGFFWKSKWHLLTAQFLNFNVLWKTKCFPFSINSLLGNTTDLPLLLSPISYCRHRIVLRVLLHSTLLIINLLFPSHFKDESKCRQRTSSQVISKVWVLPFLFLALDPFSNRDFLFSFLKGLKSAKTHYIHLFYFFKVQLQHLHRAIISQMTRNLCVFPEPWGQKLFGWSQNKWSQIVCNIPSALRFLLS